MSAGSDLSGGTSLSAIARAALGADIGGGDRSAVTAADLPAAVAAARAEGHAAGKAEGEKVGATAAYQRLSAILGDEKVKGRESAAIDLAIASPEMSADSVVAFVSKHGAAAGPAPANAGSRLDALMDDPKIEATGGAAAPTADPWAASVASVNARGNLGRG